MVFQETVSIACINFCTKWGDKAANLSKMKVLTIEAARQVSFKYKKPLSLGFVPQVCLWGKDGRAEDGSAGQRIFSILVQNPGQILPGS